MELPIHYRYTDAIGEDGFYLVEHKFYPIRETECFYFVLPEWKYNVYKNGCMPSYAKTAKRVSKNGLRRKCYPTKKLAMESYLARKRKQVWHAQDALNKARYALSQLSEDSKFSDFEVDKYCGSSALVGRPDFIDEYIFD